MNRNEHLINWLKNKAAKAYEEKSLVLQLVPIFLIFSALCLILPILSGITEFTELYHEFNAMNSNTGLLLAIVVLLAIEAIKVVSIAICFVKWFSGRMANIGVFLLLVIFAQGSSVYFSMQGSKRVPKMLHSEPVYNSRALIDIDSIKVANDSIIAAKEAIRDDFFKAYYKVDAKTGENRLSSKYSVDKRAQDMDIRTAEKQRQIYIDKAESKNIAILAASKADHTKTLSKFKERINVSSNKIWYWSVVIETLFFFSSLFVFWYLSKVLTDNGTTTGTVKGTDKKPINTKKERITGTIKKTAIAHLGTDNGTDKNGTARGCLNCGTDITAKRSDAKYCKPKCRVDHFKMRK